MIKREQQCWAFDPQSRWHGYAGYAQGYAMVDPNKLTLLTPGIDRRTGEYLSFGVPATVVANLRSRKDLLRDAGHSLVSKVRIGSNGTRN